MPSKKNRRWLLEKRPDGPVGEANFRWSEGEVPTPSAGQMLVRNLWFEYGPTQLFSMANEAKDGGVDLGGPMTSFAVSQVLESHLPSYRPGDLVHGASYWEDYSVVDGHGFFETTKLPEGVGPRLALGTLGITGMTAYFGMTEVARPRPGETLVVSAAAGGVGSVAAQIGRIQGLRVVGIAGGKEKCRWLLEEARLDAAIDHRSEKVPERLRELCPDGIDIYFDNVGGPMLETAIERLRPRGRVVLCGGTSRYAQVLVAPPPGPKNYLDLVMVNGRMEGLLGKDYQPRFPEALPVLRRWVESGQLKSKEDVLVGLENAPKGLARLFEGANLGKQLLKVEDPTPQP